MERIQKINVLENTTGENSEIVHDLRTRLESAGFRIVEGLETDLFVTVGGDGTYLWHSHNLDYPETPFVGVNAGSLGYLQEIEMTRMNEFIDDLQSGEYTVAKRSLMSLRNVGSDIETYALNDAYIERSTGSAMNAKLTIDGAEFAKFVGDGLILSTPSGSTAYNAAAGGPTLSEGLDAFVITPSNSFDTSIYESIRAPLVFPAETKVEIEILEPQKRPARVCTDGPELGEGLIDINIPIVLTKADKQASVLRTNKFNFFERLAQKTIHRK